MAGLAHSPHPRHVGTGTIYGPDPRCSCHTLVDDAARLYGLAQGHGQGPAAEAAAAASLRACARARATTPTHERGRVALMFEGAALELHQLRSVQHAYAGMTSTLALMSFDEHEVELGLAGDCVAFVEREGSWAPLAHGGPQWLGPAPEVEAAVFRLSRRSSLRMLLAVGGALCVLAEPSPAPRSVERLRERCVQLAPLRDAGLVLVELS